MGTGCSKVVVGSSRRRRGPSLRSFCSGGCSYSLEHDDDRLQRKQNARTVPGGDQTMKGPNKVKQEGCMKGERLGTAQVSSVPANIEFDGWIHETASSDQSVAAYSLLSNNLSVSDATAVLHERTLGYPGSNSNVVRDSNLCAVELPWMDSSDVLQFRSSTTMVQQPDHVNCTSTTMPELAGNEPYLDSRSETAHDEPMHAHRQIGTTELLQTGMQFSRTLSVGRLRDRVLQRNASSVVPFNHMEDDDTVRDVTRGNVPVLYDLTSEVVQQSAEIPQASTNNDVGGSSIRPSNSSDQLDVGNQQPIDVTDDNPSSSRMTFLERRQRVRSQVRALHRLGSRFENLVGHDRSCILSGQHRRGRCLCRANIRTGSTEGDANTRASISRIVMLAEALFDVLDEIHQQSVVLSSWPSVPSLGSVPAPKEVVERLPINVYNKSNITNEEAAQCYICLVEYEEGDCLRILPCHHMFHQSCVDKWLKEVRRVCPLCRGNICTSNSLPLETG
ncbi:unnamed protein product [Victoria cruziana]